MKKLILLFSIVCCCFVITNFSVWAVLGKETKSNLSFTYYSGFDKKDFAVRTDHASRVMPLTRGENSDELVYSVSPNPGNPVDALYFNNASAGDRIYLAFCFESDDLKDFIGADITSINVTSGINYDGLNPIKDISVFVTEDLGSTPVFTQIAELGDAAYAVNPIRLDTPYHIKDNSPIYIGYYFNVPQEVGFYVPFDGIRSSKDSNLYAVSGNSWPSLQSWGNLAPDNGNLCISVTLRGDDLPKNCAAITKADFPDTLVPGDEFGYWLTIANKGTAEIKEVEIETEINGMPSYYTATLDGSYEVFVSGVKVEESGIFDLKARITKVNGEENLYMDDYKIAQVACYSGGFQQNAVVEEATGTWCGYCPAGIVMCEYIREKYADRIFPIAVHSGDRMEIAGYQDFINEFISGFPSAIADRKEQISVGKYGADRLYEQIKDKNAYCGVSLTAEREDDVLNIDAAAEFVLNTDIEHRLSFVVVEDGVGPYMQTNYYGSGSGLGIWDTAGSQVLTYFDDVARSIYTYRGIEGSLPKNVEKGGRYSLSCRMDISEVKSSVFRVIALVTNAVSGEVVNSAQYTVAPEGFMYLNKNEINMTVGDITKLTAIVVGAEMYDKDIEWSSSDEGVVFVDNDGNVSAVGPGEAVITAVYGDKSASCSVSVSLIGSIVMSGDLRYQIVDDNTCSVAMPEVEGDYPMEKVVVPPSIEVFGKEYTVVSLLQGAFSLCSNLREILLPSTLTSLEGWAFNGCGNLKEISIPSSVWLINTCAFQGCDGLEKVELNEGLSVIWYNAFSYCGKLSEIVLPASLEEIGGLAFVGCVGIQSITCMAAYPPLAHGEICGDYEDIYDNCVLKVPAGSVDIYKEDRFWGMFKTIEEIKGEDGVEGISIGESLCDVYSLDGVLIMTGKKSNGLHDCLDAGLYILRYADGKTERILIQ